MSKLRRVGGLAALTLLTVLAAATAAQAASTDPGPAPDGTASAGITPGSAAVAPQAAPAGYPVTGIDVSNYQPNVNWSSVAAAGADFAYVKATEGNGYLSPSFSDQYSGAKAAGLYTGAYDFGRPDQRGGASEADFFLDHAGYTHDGRTLPPMLDIEWPYKNSSGSYVAPYPCYGLSASAMVSWIHAFVDEVRARTGQHTMIYSATSWWNQCTGSNGSFGGEPLFIANYTGTYQPLPPGWSQWTLWQYADGGSLPGDQDVFNGSLGDLAALAGGSAVGNGVAAGDVSGDGRADLVARKADGTLWLYTNSGSDTTPYGTGVQVGTAWQQFAWFLVGDVTGDGAADLVGAKPDGTLWLYPRSSSPSTPYGSGRQVGSAWQQFTHVALADVTGDGRADLVATKPDGTLWLYANSGSDTTPYGGGTQVGSSWSAFRFVLAGDVTGDGRADMVATKSDGTLWLYANSGSNTTPYGKGTRIGSSWQQFDRIMTSDVTGDGRADLVASKPDGTLWLYVNSGSASTPFSHGTQVGSSWQQFV